MSIRRSHNSRTNIVIIISRLLVILAIIAGFLLPANSVSADWTSPMRVSDGPGNNPKLAVDGVNLHVLYNRGAASAGTAYKHSDNGGRTWSSTVIFSGAGYQGHSNIAVSGSNVHMTWCTAANVFYRRSTDGGHSWSESIAVGSDAGAAYARIAAAGNNVYIALLDASTNTAWVKRSDDGGVTWQPAVALSAAGESSQIPQIAASGSYVHVVWEDVSPAVHYARSANNGVTWDPAVALPMTGFGMAYPSVAASGGTAHVVFYTVLAVGAEVGYMQSSDSGVTWTTSIPLGNDAHPMITRPIVAVDGVNVYTIWEGATTGPNLNMYLAKSVNGGTSWSPAEVLLPAKINAGRAPVLGASSGGHIFTVFLDIRTGDTNPAVYLMKTITASQSAVFTIPRGIVKLNTSVGYLEEARAVNACTIPGYTFPYGMFSFRVTELSPGETVAVTITFPGKVAGTKYFKCWNRTVVDCSSFASMQDLNTIRLMLTDGGNGDSDHLANGTVNDPGGPGFPVAAEQARGASAPVAPAGPVALSNIKVQSASLSDARVAPGTPVTVKAQLANEGAINGQTRIVCYVNGQEESAQGVTVSSGASTPVTFTVSRSDPGTYSVYVGGTQAGTFIVDSFADFNMVLWISLGAVGFALVIGALYLTGRRRQD